ncbi:MAG TPA: GNAT family N-acetyltransferase [Candidatus Elarobacter sp.]|jgi:GNAT superfamily N-acetyltransferase
MSETLRFDLEDPHSTDARWCLAQYFAEIDRRFEGGFDEARSLAPDAGEFVPPKGRFVVVRLEDAPVGCGALKLLDGVTAELKRMWISPAARGRGAGRRLLAELERLAGEAGASVVRLETNRVLPEAIALYHRSGYAEIPPYNDEPYAHHWFEKRLT